jgi:2-haloacid dehalogenase
VLDLSRFATLSFDCYGTLIDWETGIIQAMRQVLDLHSVALTDEQILDAFSRFESVAQQPPYSSYREVLTEVLERTGEEHDFRPSQDDLVHFSSSVADWPDFPDSAGALARLKRHYRLAVITNCDDDLFAASNMKLSVEFDVIVTAQQARCYKPDLTPFRIAFERIDGAPGSLLHVAQSMFHDHEPAKRLGLTTVWINRRHDRTGPGADPPAEATANLVFPDLASFAGAVETAFSR